MAGGVAQEDPGGPRRAQEDRRCQESPRRPQESPRRPQAQDEIVGGPREVPGEYDDRTTIHKYDNTLIQSYNTTMQRLQNTVQHTII